MSETWVDLSMDIQIRRILPAAVPIMQEKNSTFTNVDEQANVFAAPVDIVSMDDQRKTCNIYYVCGGAYLSR